jgi:hypothetical protein
MGMCMDCNFWERSAPDGRSGHCAEFAVFGWDANPMTNGAVVNWSPIDDSSLNIQVKTGPIFGCEMFMRKGE